MEHSTKSRSKVSIQEHQPLVDINKSKRLAAFATPSTKQPPAKTNVLAASSDVESALQQARQLIDQRIQQIMNSLPIGKRTKLFNLRFGSVEKLYALEIKVALQRLDIDTTAVNGRALAGRNYHGDLL